MRIIKAIGSYSNDNRFDYKGMKTLYADSSPHNDLQDIMNVLFFNKTVIPENIWLFGDGTPIKFGDDNYVLS